jgi:hypothetical protein
VSAARTDDEGDGLAPGPAPARGSDWRGAGPEPCRSSCRARGRGQLLLGFGALLGACWPGLAGASDLSWSGPADCARSEQLVFQVERALGAPLAETGHVHLQVHVARTAPTARALLRIADGSAEPAISERRLTAPDCDKLVDTLAVAIALAIEAAAPPLETPPLETPPPETPLSETPPPLASGTSAVARVEPAPPVVAVVHSVTGANVAPLDRPPLAATASSWPIPRVTARLLGDRGSLPGPGLGIGVGALLGWARWQLELSGALWDERHARLDSATTPGAGANLSLVTGALAACALPLDENSVAIALCAGWEMGRVSGVGTGITSPRRASGLWLAPGIEAGLTWRPADSRLGIGARIGAAAPLGPRSFYLERLGTVHEVQSLVARAGLSVDVALQ